MAIHPKHIFDTNNAIRENLAARGFRETGSYNGFYDIVVFMAKEVDGVKLVACVKDGLVNGKTWSEYYCETFDS